MSKKKDEHDMLEGTHIYQIWRADLDAFEAALSKQEQLDEQHRLTHKGMKLAGKSGARKKIKAAGAKKGPAMEEDAAASQTAKAAKKIVGLKKPGPKPADQPGQTQKEVSTEPGLNLQKEYAQAPQEKELTLRERLAARQGPEEGKMPRKADLRYDDVPSLGKGTHLASLNGLTSRIGQKRARAGEEDSDPEGEFRLPQA
jgi:hypothetical protein